VPSPCDPGRRKRREGKGKEDLTFAPWPEGIEKLKLLPGTKPSRPFKHQKKRPGVFLQFHHLQNGRHSHSGEKGRRSLTLGCVCGKKAYTDKKRMLWKGNKQCEGMLALPQARKGRGHISRSEFHERSRERNTKTRGGEYSKTKKGKADQGHAWQR